MKKTIFVLAFILQSLAVFANPYKSIFSTDTTRWNVFEVKPDAGGTIVYFSCSDTLINSKTYHKMFRERIYSADQKIGKNAEICGYVREDTLSGKYWFCKFADGVQKEAVFIDLSLNLGDTARVITDFRYMRSESVIVDSVYYIDKKKVVTINKLHYSGNESDKIKFIEGIGATNGFYMSEDYESSPHEYTLMCKFENGVKIFALNKDWSINCYHDGGGAVNETEINSNIEIYPNPASEYIEIANIGENTDIKILNTFGERITDVETHGPASQQRIDISRIPAGLYFIQIGNNTQKFMIAR